MIVADYLAKPVITDGANVVIVVVIALGVAALIIYLIKGGGDE